MGLTKLNGYTGEAEILGQVLSVQYQNGALTIYGVDLPQSYAVLDKLATGALVAVRPPMKDTAPAATPVKEKKPEPARPEPTQAKEPAREPPKPEQKEPVKEVKEPAKETTTAAPPKEDPALEFPPKEQAPPGDIPEKILKSGRFIEVMDWVMKSKGLKAGQVDEIVTACEALKPHVKVVERVRDVREKVVSNLQAYAEAGQGA